MLSNLDDYQTVFDLEIKTAPDFFFINRPMVNIDICLPTIAFFHFDYAKLSSVTWRLLLCSQTSSARLKTKEFELTELKRRSNDQSVPCLFNALSFFLPVGLAISQVGNRANDPFLLVTETRDLSIALGISISTAAFFRPVGAF